MPVTTVLLSGGMDSMACVHAAQSAGAHVQGLFIDYGQASAAREEVAARNVADHFGIPLSVIRVAGLAPLIAGNGFIMGRNMALCVLALMNVRHRETTISLGIHSGSVYCDCSPEFLALAQQVADLYTQGIVTIAAPFLHQDKVDISIYCLRNRLPRELTYSCDLGLDQPCGICASCKAILKLYPPA